MKVLHVVNTLGIAGTEVLLVEMAPKMRDRGIEVAIYTVQSTGTHLENQLDGMGIPLYRGSHSSFYSPFRVIDLVRHLRTHRYDLIHVHLFPAQLWVAIAAILSKSASLLVTTEHSTHNRRRVDLLKWLDRWTYSRYSQVCAISEGTAKALEQWVPILHNRVRIIPNGAHLGRFSGAHPMGKQAIIKSDAPLVLCVGRLKPEKGQDDLLKAIVDLKDVHLGLVGDGPMRSELEKLSHNLGITDRVHFLGRRSDVPEIIKSADIYVQSSKWEGFGIAALEAMAGGLPVIASRVPGLTEVVGEAGLLFEVGDHKTLAQHIRYLLANPDERARLSILGQEQAQRFSIEQTVERYLELYKEMLPSLNSSK